MCARVGRSTRWSLSRDEIKDASSHCNLRRGTRDGEWHPDPEGGGAGDQRDGIQAPDAHQTWRRLPRTHRILRHLRLRRGEGFVGPTPKLYFQATRHAALKSVLFHISNCRTF